MKNVIISADGSNSIIENSYGSFLTRMVIDFAIMDDYLRRRMDFHWWLIVFVAEEQMFKQKTPLEAGHKTMTLI